MVIFDSGHCLGLAPATRASNNQKVLE